MKENRNKYLLKNTIIFAIGNIGTKFINFFLVPLYTNILTTSEYGIVDLVNIISTVAVPVISLNIGEAIMRFCLDKDADQDKIMSIGFVILVFSTTVSIFLFPIVSLFQTISTYSIYVYLYTITSAYTQIFLCYLRGKEYLLQYSIGNIIQSLFIAILNIYFLSVLNMGVEGYLLAYIVSNTITAIYAMIIGNSMAVLKKFRFDYRLSIQMTKYSIVLIPNSFMWWIMNSLDRIMITAMVGVSVNGIYAVAYKVPTLLTTVTNIFNQAWSYSAIRENESPDQEEYNNKIYDNLFSLVILVACGLIMIMKIFLKYYVGKDYYMAWKYTPYLIVGFVFNSLGSFIATSYTVHKDSWGFLLSGTIGAIANIILNFLLIPFWGATGAAFATCMSYFLVYLFRAINTRKYLKVKILRPKHIFGYILLSIISMTMFIDNIYGQAVMIIEFIIILAVFYDFWIGILKTIFRRIKN